jgi:hypothetical protein
LGNTVELRRTARSGANLALTLNPAAAHEAPMVREEAQQVEIGGALMPPQRVLMVALLASCFNRFVPKLNAPRTEHLQCG